MRTRLIGCLCLVAIICSIGSLSAETSDRPAAARATIDNKTPVDDYTPKSSGKHSLGQIAPAQLNSMSPGIKIGDTWYDYQHNGSIGRMIDWGKNGDTMLVHFSWMRLPENDAGLRTYRYNYYDARTGELASDSGFQASDDWSGYVGIDVRGDNIPFMGGHERPLDIFQSAFYWNDGPGLTDFPNSTRLPDSLAEYSGHGSFTPGNEASWPKFRLQETSPDTVLHVACQVIGDDAGNIPQVFYFRRIGFDSSGVWEYPPRILDSVWTNSHDIAASNTTGKVALAWTAGLAKPDPCGINSGEQPYWQYDNNIYYQISYDQGATWQPRVNLNCNIEDEAGYRPYTDLSLLIDTDENLHIVWNGRVWPAYVYDSTSSQDDLGLDCSIFHWSEGTNQITKIHDAEWTQTTCNGGNWQLNTSKMTISECDGRFYCLWVQFNDAPHGVLDDCSDRAFSQSDPLGSANGDLWYSLSRDGGLTWDPARNLTNTYSPGCLPGECESEHWPSMTRFGTNLGNDWSGAVVVDPSGGYSGDYFLDVQYVLDPDAGGIVQDEGTWQLAELRWFRLPCVDSTYLASELCCIGDRGNVNGDPEDAVNISDLTCIIGYLFGPPPPAEPECEIACAREANANGDPDEAVNISDVTFLVSYLFGTPSDPAPGPCPY